MILNLTQNITSLEIAISSLQVISWTNWKINSHYIQLGYRANYCPQNWRVQQTNTKNHNLPKQRSRSRNLHGSQYKDRESWTIIEMLETKCWEAREAKIPEKQGYLGGPHSSVSFTSWSFSTLFATVDIRENPLVLSAGEGEEKPFLNMPEHFVFLTRSAHRWNCLART